MGDYDYLNARVRSMAAGLLGRDFYEQVLATTGEDLLVDALLNSTYGPYLREALAEHHGIAAVELALRREIFDTFARVRSYAPPRVRRLLNVQFNQWDTANVLAIARGKVTGASPAEIMEGVLPAGEYSAEQLATLAAEPDLRSLADALTTWGYPFAFELRQAIRDTFRLTDLAALEAEVGRAFFEWALGELEGPDGSTRVVREMLRMQIDLANIKGALDRVRHRAAGEELDGFGPLQGGLLERRTVEEIAGAGSMVEAFEVLEDTYYSPAIERGILSFGRGGYLGAMERYLEVIVIGAGCRLLRRDPLDVSVPLGFIWRKYNEFVNLRILVRGKAYRMPDNRIREEMLIV